MSYDVLRDRLEPPSEPRRIVAMPDGSVDRRYAVDGLDGDRVRSLEAFGRQVAAADGDAFGLEAREMRPAGQAVNAAMQVDALGGEVAVVGHLDHPIFSLLPGETASIGDPARVDVLTFPGEEIQLVDRPGEAAVSDAVRSALEDFERSADAYCCANWVAFRDLESIVAWVAARADAPIVVDPGHLETADPDAVADVLESFGAAPTRVVLSVNPTECAAGAAALEDDGPRGSERDGGTGDDDTAVADAATIRALAGLPTVVHGADRAVAATPDGIHTLEMRSVDDVVTTTGAGDRFTAGLAYALARDDEWHWPEALALGNVCAARFVATGRTADRDGVIQFLERR